MAPALNQTPSLALVFDRLLSGIVSGHYAPGTRLPSERDLAKMIGASRPTLREALRRLGEWRLVAVRRGSGVVVRELRDWSIDVLPAYLRFGAPATGPRAVGALLVDLLAMRRALMADVIKEIIPRLEPGMLDPARAQVQRAWAARNDVASFVREDFEVFRICCESAHFLPGLWFLNSYGSVYMELADSIASAGVPLATPDDYLDIYTRFLDLVEKKDGDGARDLFGTYLEEHDKKLLALLGANN